MNTHNTNLLPVDIPPFLPDTPDKIEQARVYYDRFNDLAARYRDDASLRASVDGGEVSGVLAELGLDLPVGIDARIVADTDETMHLVLPPDPNAELSDEALDMIAGGKSASSAACGSSASTVGSASTTVSSASSAACAGSAASAS